MKTFKTSVWPVPRRHDSGRKGSLGSYLKVLGRTFIERYNGAHHMAYSSGDRAAHCGFVVGLNPTKAIRHRTLYEFERSLLLDESIVDTSERRRALVSSTKGEVNSFSRCKYEFESRWHLQQGFESLEIVGLYLST